MLLEWSRGTAKVARVSIIHRFLSACRLGIPQSQQFGRAAHQPTRKPFQRHGFLCNSFRLSVKIP